MIRNERTHPAVSRQTSQPGGSNIRVESMSAQPPYSNHTTSERDFFTLSKPSDRCGAQFSRDDIDTLKSLMPAVLNHYGVTNINRNFSSPWREDLNPSAAFYSDNNLVHDFGTGETVNVFDLVGKVEGINYFPDQVRRVAEIVSYTLEDAGSTQHLRVPAVQRPRFELPAAAGFGEEPIGQYAASVFDLLENRAALAYLHGRGFTNQVIDDNVIGYVRDPKDISPAFTLFEPNETLGYIVIPFAVDETFCAVNYAMLRAIPANTPPMHKEIRPTGFRSPLYREWLVGACCRVLYVTEGLLDCLALEMLIGKPCLGLGGTGGARRLGSLLYYTHPDMRPQKVILALDADDAGRKTAGKLLDDIRSIGIPCAIMPMPEGCKDPNDALMMIGE